MLGGKSYKRFSAHYCYLIHSDVRVDTGLNKHIWSMGVRNVAKRIRVRLSRRRNEDEEAKEKVRLGLSIIHLVTFKRD
jgi:large subunit ribosomal protein L31e